MLLQGFNENKLKTFGFQQPMALFWPLFLAFYWYFALQENHQKLKYGFCPNLFKAMSRFPCLGAFSFPLPHLGTSGFVLHREHNEHLSITAPGLEVPGIKAVTWHSQCPWPGAELAPGCISLPGNPWKMLSLTPASFSPPAG